MFVITKQEIKKLISSGDLIVNARLKNNEPDVENASYDLMAGIAICKKGKQKSF